MIDGTGPRINKPGEGPVGNTLGAKEGTVADKGRESFPMLLARAECVELCLPSDLWDSDRSPSG